MNLLSFVTNYPYEILGGFVAIPLVGSWIGAYLGARTGTSSAFKRAYQRRR